MGPGRMYSIQRFQPLFYRLANNEKQGVRSHTVSVSGKAHKIKCKFIYKASRRSGSLVTDLFHFFLCGG